MIGGKAALRPGARSARIRGGPLPARGLPHSAGKRARRVTGARGTNAGLTDKEDAAMFRLVPAILMLITLVVAPARAQQEHAHAVAMPETLKWVEPAVLPGAKLAVVHGDPSKEGLFVYRLKMPAAYRIPPHVHKASENVTVLSGVFFIGVGEKFDTRAGQELPTGGFVSIPPSHPHFAWVGDRETIVQVHGVGPTNLVFVDPADDPRKKQ